MAKTIEQKMAHPTEPQVKTMGAACGNNFPEGTMLIATPRLVDETIRSIGRGKILTLTELRHVLADQYEVDYTCALTTGIFLRIVAEHAEHQRMLGNSSITPYWRVVRADHTLNPKYPGGVEAQAEKLRAEGHTLVTTGDNSRVVTS